MNQESYKVQYQYNDNNWITIEIFYSETLAHFYIAQKQDKEFYRVIK